MVRTVNERLHKFATTLDDEADNYIPTVATLADLPAALLNVAVGKRVDVLGRTATGDGYQGSFFRSNTDYSAEVAVDTQQGIYIDLGDGTYGVRSYGQVVNSNPAVKAAWFGFTPSATSAENNTAMSVAKELAYKGTLEIGGGTHNVSDQFEVSHFTSIEGVGPDTTIVQNGTNKAIFIVGTDPTAADTEAVPGYSEPVNQITPYQPGHISGITFLGTGTAAMSSSPYSGTSEQAGVVLGGGVYGTAVDRVCWLYEVRSCHFRGFKRGVVFGCRIQGPTVVKNCAFVLNHIAIENFSYFDGGPGLVTSCEFIVNGHDFKSLGGVAAYGSLSEPSYTDTWRGGLYDFEYCYFAGVNGDAPGVFNNYSYPDTTEIAASDILPHIFVDGGIGAANATLTVRFNRCAFEQGTTTQTRAVLFNKQYSGLIKLEMQDCEFGFGYAQTDFPTANRPEALIDARCGLISLKGCSQAQFGDTDAQYDAFVRIWHDNTAGNDFEKYRGAYWEVEAEDAAATTSITTDIIHVETARSSGTATNLASTDPVEQLRAHYVAKEATNMPVKQDRKKLHLLPIGTTNLAIEHYNSVLMCDDTGSYTITLPTIGNNWYVGLWFEIVNLSGSALTVSTADAGKIFTTSVANGNTAYYELMEISGDVRWVSKVTPL